MAKIDRALEMKASENSSLDKKLELKHFEGNILNCQPSVIHRQ